MKAEVKLSRKYEFNGKKFVELQGFLENLGLFKFSCDEKLVPDGLEGHVASIDFGIKLVNFKPQLKVKSISLVEGE